MGFNGKLQDWMKNIKRHTLETIKMLNMCKAVCKYYRLSKDALFSKSRKRNIVTARHMFHYLCYMELNISSGAIGEFSNRDHATVLHSCQQIKNWSDTSKAQKSDVQSVKALYKKPNKWDMLRVTFYEFIKDLTGILKTNYA